MIDRISSRHIVGLFVAVKIYLIGLALIVPLQYDTSSTLLFPHNRFLSKMVIWDSVFFVSSAERTHLYEHEWAFSWMWSRFIGMGRSREFTGYLSIAISNLCHLAATFVLRKLTQRVFHDSRLANVTAMMYVLSPAGIFLAAGYTEAPFALLSFLGLYFRQIGYHPIAGLLLGLSCLLRGNGILWGIPFLFDLLCALRTRKLKMAFSIVIGGTIIAAFFIYTQYLPWSLFCPQRGEWCDKTIPSIYGYVQERYWNVGFLRYWTPNNIPNFMFAFPVLFLMASSASSMQPTQSVLPLFAVHIVMGFCCLLIWHVQIITRISTCLPTLYWYMAKLALSQKGDYVFKYVFVWITFQVVMWGAYLPPA